MEYEESQFDHRSNSKKDTIIEDLKDGLEYLKGLNSENFYDVISSGFGH